jgi:hypothetical protein
MQPGLGGVTRSQPGHRQPEFGALGLQPGAGARPVAASGLRGQDHQRAFVGAAFGLVLQRRGQVVAGHGQRPHGGVAVGQQGCLGGGHRFLQQLRGTRDVVLLQRGGSLRGHRDALAGFERGAHVAFGRRQADAGAPAAQRLAADALHVEGRPARQRRQELQAVAPGGQVHRIDMVGQPAQRDQLVLGADGVQQLRQPQRHAGCVVGMVGPGLVDGALQGGHGGWRWSRGRPQ